MQTPMPLYWLAYRDGGAVAIIIQPAHSAIAARFKAALAGADDAKFTEGHLLPVKVAKKVPEAMIGRALSGQEATALLKKLK